MTYEEIADKYIRESYIDYGDLNEKAEQQIKEAVIFGLKQGELLPVVVGSSLKIPDVKIIVGNAEITFEGKKEVMLSEIAKAYFKIESYLKKNGYHI